jgi:pimeloyl-ACP methyl ester carboxylesterase
MIIVLEEIFNALGIHSRQFILVGYSMGGRIALSLLEQIPESISRLILLAPDGMKMNFWYWLATQTSSGNRLFRFTMNNPGWFLHMLHLAHRCNLINKSVYKFIITYFDDKNVRDQLFHRWTCMRRFKPDLKKTREIIRQRQVPVRMVYGKHDRIILASRAGKFLRGIESLCQVHIINAGHQVLQKKYAEIIIRLLTT